MILTIDKNNKYALQCVNCKKHCNVEDPAKIGDYYCSICYCLECHELYSGKCVDCAAPVCTNCGDVHVENDIYMPTKCYKCGAYVCGDCLHFCAECWNINGEYKSFCGSCSKIKYDVANCICSNTWGYCPDHDEDSVECGYCLANENYCKKNEFTMK